jgi:glycosyltransferase 2 family protein
VGREISIRRRETWGPEQLRTAEPAQLACGTAVLGLSLLAASRGTVGRVETEVFQAVNSLPDNVLPIVWPIMQAGAFGAVPAAAVLATVAGRPRLALRLGVSGTASYLIAKGIKQVVRRGRPSDLLDRVVVRGKTQTGLGYLSGHAAVSAALACAAQSALSPGLGSAAIAAAGIVAVARIYVGAHLPLDVLGGAAFGWTLSALTGTLLTLADAYSQP